MSHAYTIILPHKRNKGNDEALKIAVEMLMQNSAYDFHLLIDAPWDKPLYPLINALVNASRTECVVYWSSDLFPAPDWDITMLALWESDPQNLIVTNVVIEPGVMGIHPQNHEHDFGRRPETFQRDEFEQYALTAPVPDGYGWGTPWMMGRTQFLRMDGFRTDLPTDEYGFSGGDNDFFVRWMESGKRIERARSFVYHLQRYSHAREQAREERDR